MSRTRAAGNEPATWRTALAALVSLLVLGALLTATPLVGRAEAAPVGAGTPQARSAVVARTVRQRAKARAEARARARAKARARARARRLHARRATMRRAVVRSDERVLGLASPGLPWDTSAFEATARDLGHVPGQATFYTAWSAGGDFPVEAVGRLADLGTLPAMTWEPWDPAAGVEQPAYALRRIAAGDHDAYLTRWARQVRAYQRPLVVRFAHEMNGTWYPWAAGVNGNTAADYVAAWRHVRSVFARQRANNVIWTWSPNIPYPGSSPLGPLFPGDKAVDRVGLDGYNWSTLLEGTAWTSFADTFGPGLAELRSLSNRPLVVGETASTEVGGDKALWVREMFAALAEHPELRTVTWFDLDKETDWRVGSSAGSRQAFLDGLPGYLG